MRGIVLLVSLVLSWSANAAGFDCAKAATAIEVLICSNAQLSEMDDKISILYRQAVARSTEQNLVKQGQRDWLRDSRNQCDDKQCLEGAYAARIAQLSSTVTGSMSAASVKPADVQQSARQVDPAPTEVVNAKAAQLMSISPDALGATEQASPVSNAPEAVNAQDAVTTTHPAVALEPRPVVQSVAALASQTGAGMSTSLILKLVAIGLLINALVSMYLHSQGKLTIYSDYTDAFITGMTPLTGLATYMLLRFLEVPEQVALIISFSLTGVLLLLMVKATHKENGLSIYFLMALTTKITVVTLYYAIMALHLMGNGSARKKGERLSTYEARQRRESRQSAAAMVAATTVFTVWSAWFCRNAEFTSMKAYLSHRPS